MYASRHAATNAAPSQGRQRPAAILAMIAIAFSTGTTAALASGATATDSFAALAAQNDSPMSRVGIDEHQWFAQSENRGNWATVTDSRSPLEQGDSWQSWQESEHGPGRDQPRHGGYDDGWFEGHHRCDDCRSVAPPPVPEPASWVLAIAGLVTIGMHLGRRRNRAGRPEFRLGAG